MRRLRLNKRRFMTFAVGGATIPELTASAGGPARIRPEVCLHGRHD